MTDRIFRATGNGGQEATGLRNQLCGWIGKEMGIPYLHSHYMQVWRNGGQFYNLTQDEEVPTADYAKAWFPSSDEGDHYKIAVWFEFQDDNSTFAATGATLESFKTTSGAYKLPRYRFNWQTRGYQGTADNYTNIFDLVAVTDPDLPKQKFSFLLRRADGTAATGPQTDSDSGLISWTPGEDDGPGTNRYVVVVTDSGVPPATVESAPFRIIVLESNLPPVITPVADRKAFVGDKVTFPVVATDPDRPAQALSFALDVAPAGASIDARSGVIAGTPAASQSGIQRFVVRVSDDGSPSRDATAGFRIDVADSGTPALTASLAADRTVTLVWPSSSGVRYRVESRDLLTAPWQTLADFTGTGTAMTTTDASGTRRERYYRLTLP